jgi:hypothetical protein
MPKHFHEVASAPTEYIEIASMRIALQRLLHLEGQAIHAAAHVGMARRDPHPHIRRNRNHRRGRAFITVATRSGSTAPEIRKRRPRPNSNSISGIVAGDAAEVSSALGSGPAIVTGVKPIGVDMGAVQFSASRYCLRQPNSMLRLMLCRRATPLTVSPSINVSATSARFSSSLQHRRA